MSYLKAIWTPDLLALSFLLATTVIKSVIPLWLLTLSTSISAISTNSPWPFCWSTMVFTSCKLWFQYVGNLLFARVSYSIVRDIRRDAFANMEKLDMSYFDKTPAGSIVSRLTNDTGDHQWYVSGILSSFISAVFIFLTTLYTMLVLDFRLLALVLLFLPLIFPFGQSLSKNNLSKIIEKTKVSCLISIVS